MADFDPMVDKMEKMLAWVRFPYFPIEYYNIIFLRKLGEKIGRPIRIDQATSQVFRGRFARLCVEIDITKPLVSKFKLRKRIRHVEYEGIHMVCFQCDIYGHREETCPTSRMAAGEMGQGTTDAVENHGGADRVTVWNKEQYKEGVAVKEIKESFRPWMLANKKRRRITNRKQDNSKSRESYGKGYRKNLESAKNNVAEKIMSHYGALAGIQEDWEDGLHHGNAALHGPLENMDMELEGTCLENGENGTMPTRIE